MRAKVRARIFVPTREHSPREQASLGPVRASAWCGLAAPSDELDVELAVLEHQRPAGDVDLGVVFCCARDSA